MKPAGTRLGVLLLLVLLAGLVRAEDDDTFLDTKPLGEPIPERLERLEREWAEDVGAKEALDPTDDPASEDEDMAPRGAEEEHDDEVPPAARAPIADPGPTPKRTKGPLEEPADAGAPSGSSAVPVKKPPLSDPDD